MQASNESSSNDRRVVIAPLLRSLFQNEKERASASYFFRAIPVAARAKTAGPPGELMYL